MAKDKGKKFKTKGKKISRPNAKMKKVKVPRGTPTKAIVPALLVPLTGPSEATASEPERNSNGGATRGKEKEREKSKRLSGFIFMCSPSTKLECYQYRVFGLPTGKKEVVEEIKPGAKLFLFDFELKLLYGTYEATSVGKLNLEPAAFRGKFPAQVKFKIFKECLPLHESSLRHIIKENYSGMKFKQELSGKQVRKLLSSFRPLTASSSQPAPQALAYVSLSRAMPPSAMENQFKHTATLPAVEVRYLAERQYSRVPPLVEPQPVPNVNFLQHGYHRTAAYAERVPPTLDHQSLPTAGTYYVANPQQLSFTEGVAHGVQEPLYSRYRTIDERAPHDQVTNLERKYLKFPSQREARYQDNVVAYNPNQMGTAQYTSSVTQPQVLSLSSLPQRGALYQDNAVAYNSNRVPQAHYTTSVSQPQVPDPYYPLPLQTEAVYRDNAVAYNSNRAAQAQYSTSVTQPRVPDPYYPLPLQTEAIYRDNVVAYNSYPAASTQNTQPQMLAPGISRGSAPSSLYYSYARATGR